MTIIDLYLDRLCNRCYKSIKHLESWFKANFFFFGEIFNSRFKTLDYCKRQVMAICSYPLWLDAFSVKLKQ
jgi:hypothetical protein